MAVLRVTPVEVESELKDRGYFISDEHTPPDPIPHDGVHDIIPPVPIIHDGVHDIIPPVPIAHDGVHDLPILHNGVHDIIPPVPIVHNGVHDLPIVHIPADQVESRYAKYIRFLPLIMLLVPESEVLDLGRVL